MVVPVDILGGVGLMIAAVAIYVASITDWESETQNQLLSFMITGFALGGLLFFTTELGLIESTFGPNGKTFLTGGYVAILASQLLRAVIIEKKDDILGDEQTT
jgi:hypothetical protein